MPALAVFSRGKSKKAEAKGKQPESTAAPERIGRTTNGTPILKNQYVHVPTHAAADALATAPPSMRGFYDPRATSRASSVRSGMGSRSSSYDSQYHANAARGRYMSYYRDNSYSQTSFRSVASNLSNIDAVLASSSPGKSDDASLTPTSSTSTSSASSRSKIPANQYLQPQKPTSHGRYPPQAKHNYQRAPSCRSGPQRSNLHMLPKSERSSSTNISTPRAVTPPSQPSPPKPVAAAPLTKTRSHWFRFGKSQNLAVSAAA